MQNFWDTNVWGHTNLIAILLISLLVANVLKKTIKKFVSNNQLKNEALTFMKMVKEIRLKILMDI